MKKFATVFFICTCLLHQAGNTTNPEILKTVITITPDTTPAELTALVKDLKAQNIGLSIEEVTFIDNKLKSIKGKIKYDDNFDGAFDSRHLKLLTIELACHGKGAMSRISVEDDRLCWLRKKHKEMTSYAIE